MATISKSGNILIKKITKMEEDNSIPFEYVITDEKLLDRIKNIGGEGSGLDADKLDGQEGSFYRNASNLNAGTVPSARLSGTYNINISGNAATATNADKLQGLVPSSSSQPNVIPITDTNGKIPSEFINEDSSTSSIINAIIFG